jgi:predicted aconitase with swiveling domain
MLQITARGLTARERRFVRHTVQYGDPKTAVKLCEYGGNPSDVASDLMRSPKIVAAIQAEISLRIRTEGATVAHNVLMEVAKDTTAPKGVRVDAAKALLDRAGFVAPRSEAPKAQEGRPLSDYSIEELRGLVTQLERSRADQAKDVSRGVPDVEGAQLSEMLD